MEARRATAVESQAKHPMANLACTEPLTSEPVRGNIAHELTREVRFDVGAHALERDPAMRGVSTAWARWDRAQNPGWGGSRGLVFRTDRRAAATTARSWGDREAAGGVVRQRGRAEAARAGGNREGPGNRDIRMKSLDNTREPGNPERQREHRQRREEPGSGTRVQ